jgi:hypothetical protein
MRVDPLAGAWSFLALVADRTSVGLIGAVVAALLLQWLGHTFDRAFDCTMHMLVPFLLLAAIGALASELGGEMWFMPHRRLTGVHWVYAVRVLVAYGWSLVLFAVVARSVWTARGRSS